MTTTDKKYTIQEVWGFGRTIAVNADIASFLQAMHRAAVSRGILATHLPSDALDLSRDIILDEAAAALGVTWAIVPGEPLSTLRLARRGLSVDWAKVDVPDEIGERLEYLRGQIRAEAISYGEIAELQSLLPYIEDGDPLREWAGNAEAE